MQKYKYRGQSLGKDLEKIKKLHIAGNSSAAIAIKLYRDRNKRTTIDEAIKSMVEKKAPIKITKTELNQRPIILGRNQQGLSKQKQILNTPELRKEFIKYANTPGVTIKDIRKKYGIKSLYEEKRGPKKESLRDLITKKVQLGRQDVDVGVTKNMEKLQNYLSRNKIPEGQLQSGRPEYEKLIRKSGFSKNDFNRIITQLQLYYANPGEKRNLEIIPEVKKIINKFPSPRYNREILRSLGYSKKTTDILDNVERAAQQVTEAGTALEHALPKAFIKEIGLPKKYYLFGERTTNFLNQFKTQFDNQMLTAAKNFSLIENPTRQDYLDYKDEINKIRNTVAKKTGGYEMGYIDFVDGKPVPVTPQKSILEGEGDFGPRTTGLKKYFKNAYYHNKLYENYKKNPNDPDFGTLRKEIKQSKYPFVKELEAEKNYDLIKNLKTPEEFVDIYQKNPNNLFIKSLATATGRKSNLGSYLSRLSRFGKPAAIGTGLLTAMTSALSAKEKPSSNQEIQTAVQDQIIENQATISQPQTTPITEVADASSAAKMADDIMYDNVRKVFVKKNEPEVKASQSDLLYWIADNPITESPIASIGVGTAALSIPGAKETFQAARKADQGILRSTASVLGKGLTRVGSPAGTALFEIPFIAEQIKEGKSPYEILSDPLNYIGPALTESLTVGAGAIKGPSKGFLGGVKDTLTFEGVRNPRKAAPGLLNLALRLGLSPRNIALISGTGAIGAIGATALTAYDLIDAYRKGEFDNLFSSEELGGVDLSKGVSIPNELDTTGIMGLKNAS
jgi:hypothetical protein